MKIDEKARQYFDEGADELLQRIEARPVRQKQSTPRDWSGAHRHPKAHLEAEEFFRKAVGSATDQLGNERARFIRRGSQDVGLWSEGHAAFDKLVSALSRRAELSRLLSRVFIRDRLFEWVIGQHFEPGSQPPAFMTFLAARGDEAIREHSVGVVLANLEIEASFQVGKVVLDWLRRELFDAMEKDPTRGRKRVDALRERYQGAVVAKLTSYAERDKAIELGVAEAEKALIVLRFFSGAGVLAEIPCYLGRMGLVQVPTAHYYILDGEMPLFGAATEERRQYVEKISAARLRDMQELGLREFSDLMAQDAPTALEKTLLRALQLYTNGLLGRDLQDRTVLALAAAETLLLKSETEALQQNVGNRLALLAANDLEGRKEVVHAVREAYKLRSAFLHHGGENEDVEVVEKLQQHVWDGLRHVTLVRGQFESQQALVQDLDDRLLS